MLLQTDPVRRRTLRITGITSFDFHRTLDGRSWNPDWRWHERRVPLVFVQTDDGLCGVGEGWSHRNDTGPFHARLARAAPSVLGADADAIATIHARLWSDAGWEEAAVASAIDMALWDLLGQRRGVPVHALIGTAARAVPVYASGGLYTDGQSLEALGTAMHGYVTQGFRAVKLKIGAHGLADDLARAATVRAAVGRNTAIIVDALGRLPGAAAMSWVEGLAALEVMAIQAPFPVSDLASLQAVQRDGRLMVIAGEAEFRPAVFQALLHQHAVGMLQACAGLCGGITGMLQLAAAAREAGVALTPQCHGTAVLQAASLHLGAGCDAVATVEYHMFHDHLHAALPPGMLRVADGCLRLDDRPGLGLDAAALAAPGAGTLRAVVSVH
jgi:L-alanine-DL-glutamate epimerase-like enolase superfamily enzyme